ncbi:EAL domain-containing protein [Tardiphaga sp. vice352]|uniref:sensor domain-containing protein n=1 Tax=unclassified Tardiphaga TaxID=2631404 RepID=UPI001162F236|nr:MULTISPECIES: EAL domain-containing protein [unclassified Tardiphaga]QDM18604.1 EAL domain-containing protein [Tardiphaga sp. vice278]QDM23600.1 EAL domain-containing protein [Tardiphaga sp. vice154]QDM28825.1 EAL domain-containing protein [Tardiphaga sp. vice304]QDM33924.1 EAL domain-containing protein [Tardiphaga sp. vice352]
MAGKMEWTGGKALFFALAPACLLAAAAGGTARAQLAAVPAANAGGGEPQMVWEVLIGGIVTLAFMAALVLWGIAALRDVRSQERRRNAFIGSALNHLGQGIVMVDAQKRVVFCNDRYLEIYGLDRSDLTRDITADGLRHLRRARGQLDANSEKFYETSPVQGSYVAELPGGRYVRVRLNPLPNGGVIGIHEDCTEQHQLADELESTRTFLETVVDNIPVSLMVQRASDGRYLFANRNSEIILNRRREDAIGLTVADMLRPEEAKLIVSRDEAAMKSGNIMAEEHPISTRDGLRLFLTRRVTVRDEAGEPQYLIKTYEDVTDRRQTEARMAHMAYHDGLTDLPNRAAFLQGLAQMIDACGEEEEEFAVLSIDLDGLKEINDVFGYAMGDRLLVEVSRRIEVAAGGGMVARLGGDEFGVIIDGKQPQVGQAIAERISEALAQGIPIDGKSVRTGVTTGIALFPRDGADAAALLANSGAALFRAKAHSRGSISVFEPQMDKLLRDRRVLHQDLSVAIRNGELSLHYQPQARAGQSIVDADITGFEALARWIHPTRGFVPPGDFIPLAEESGLIVEMGEWILRQACLEAASWPVPLRIAVNLSPAQFMHGDLVGLVDSILLETGLEPGRLELEITEGVLIEDFERGVALLTRLKALGVRISMDDFGSGYSSLTYLQAFPFDKLKIDRAFVINLGSNPQSAAIVRAVIGLGHGLDVSIVAEGVETHEQLCFLANEGCDGVQGYFIGRPAPIAQYAGLVGRTATALRTG